MSIESERVQQLRVRVNEFVATDGLLAGEDIYDLMDEVELLHQEELLPVNDYEVLMNLLTPFME